MENHSVNGTAAGFFQSNGLTGGGAAGYAQQLLQQTLPRCECHECTQARWKMSMHGQIQSAMGQGIPQQKG